MCGGGGGGISKSYPWSERVGCVAPLQRVCRKENLVCHQLKSTI